MTLNEILEQKIAGMTTDEIVLTWDVLNQQEMTQEVPIIRGFMIDELENRDAESFENWLDSTQDSPRGFFT